MKKYFCSRCGIDKTEQCGVMCEKCKERYSRSMSDIPCGVCGQPSEMFFVHGHRCKDHKFVTEPSDAIIGDGIILVTSRM